MQSGSLPAKLSYVWGYNGSGAYTRAIPQTTTDANAASWALGFPANTFTPPNAGGTPPNGKDFNGVFAALSSALVGYQAMGLLAFDNSFATAIGGYPKGALVCDPNNLGILWQSTSENNYTTPGASANLWQSAFVNYVQKSGDTMNGVLTVDTHNGSDAPGGLRWGGNIQSQIAGYEYNWLGLYMCEVVNQYPFANLQVNGGNGARTDFHFRQDTARIETVSNVGKNNQVTNEVAFLSDIQSAVTPLAKSSDLPLPIGMHSYVFQYTVQAGTQVNRLGSPIVIALPTPFKTFSFALATDVGSGVFTGSASPADNAHVNLWFQSPQNTSGTIPGNVVFNILVFGYF